MDKNARRDFLTIVVVVCQIVACLAILTWLLTEVL